MVQVQLRDRALEVEASRVKVLVGDWVLVGSLRAVVREGWERGDSGGWYGDRIAEVGFGVRAGDYQLVEDDDGDEVGGNSELEAGGEVFDDGDTVSAED